MPPPQRSCSSGSFGIPTARQRQVRAQPRRGCPYSTWATKRVERFSGNKWWLIYPSSTEELLSKACLIAGVSFRFSKPFRKRTIIGVAVFLRDTRCVPYTIESRCYGFPTSVFRRKGNTSLTGDPQTQHIGAPPSQDASSRHS